MRRLSDLLWKQLSLSSKAERSCTASLCTVVDASDPAHVLLYFPQPNSDVKLLLQFTHLGDWCVCISFSLVLVEGA